MAKSKKSSTTTTNQENQEELLLKSSFSDPSFETLSEMSGEAMAKKIYLRGRSLEKHTCEKDGSCRHLHDLFYANIFLNAQKAFEEAWTAKTSILDAAASPLFNGICYGKYQAPRSSHDGTGYVWYMDSRPVLDEEGNQAIDEEGEELCEDMWRLKRVKEGEDLGGDRTRYKKAQAHHSFESDCWMDHRGWRPNLYFFDSLYYLVPLSEEDLANGHTKRIKLRAWDILQGSDDLKLLAQGIEVYKQAKAKEEMLEEEAAEAAVKAAAEAAAEAKKEVLRQAKLLMGAEKLQKKLVSDRKKAARAVLDSVPKQFKALTKEVEALIKNLNKKGSAERKAYSKAVLSDKVEARTLDWVKGRDFTFEEFTFLNWEGEFPKTGNVFVTLVGITTRYIPEDIWVALSLKPGAWVKAVIDAAQLKKDTPSTDG